MDRGSVVKLFGFYDHSVGVFVHYHYYQYHAFKSDWTSYLFNLQRNDNLSVYHLAKVGRKTKKVRGRTKRKIKEIVKKQRSHDGFSKK